MSRNFAVFEAIKGSYSSGRDLLKGKEEFMGGSDFFQSESQPLARYRSAPSSVLVALMDSATDNSSSGDDESESIISAFMGGPRRHDPNQKAGYHPKQEARGVDPGTRPGQDGFGSYSAGMETYQVNTNTNGNGNVSSSSSLMRQSSSPAGFFNGFGVTGKDGNYVCHNLVKPDSSASDMTNHMSFSSGPSSSSRFMPSIPENVMHHSPEPGQPSGGRVFEAAFTYEPWNHPQLNGLKRKRDGEVQMFSDFNGLENQNGECRRNSTSLVHHLSLPKTSAEMAEVEKYLQFQQETVPCQVRAKRGCATHPRSIAERMRRTRISQRIKKLQDLFPNMDKQTTTADMLDLAVEYIKDLQKQVQTLSDSRSKCACSSKPHRETSPTV